MTIGDLRGVAGGVFFVDFDFFDLLGWGDVTSVTGAAGNGDQVAADAGGDHKQDEHEKAATENAAGRWFSADSAIAYILVMLLLSRAHGKL